MAVIDNLQVYYSLENANDAHSSSLHLTNNNGVAFTAGKVANAGTFASASSQDLSRADNAAYSITGDTSIAAWFKTSSGAAQGIVCKWDGGSNLEYQLYIFENVTWLIRDTGATNESIASVSTYFDNAWHLAIATYTASDKKLRLSVDNGTEVVSGTAMPNGPVDAAAALTVGSIGGASYKNGQIDEVGIWKKVLTSDERTWLYNSGNGRSYADIVAEAGGGGTPFVTRLDAQRI